MSAKKHVGLGRGLSALLGSDAPGAAAPAAAAGGAGQRTAAIELLHPGRFQPRRHFAEEALEELARSIREQGLLQPILVRPHPTRRGEFEIVAGERRWRAAQRAGLHVLPVLARDLDDRAALQIALIENVQRQDLGALEEAEGYRRLMTEFGHRPEAIAAAIGKSRAHVANLVRLLALPEAVKRQLDAGRLSAGHARALLNAPDAVALAERIVAEDLNVRQAEALAASARLRAEGKTPARGGSGARRKDADTLALERDLARRLGLKAEIQFDGRGGRLVLHYKSLEQFDALLARLMAERE